MCGPMNVSGSDGFLKLRCEENCHNFSTNSIKFFSQCISECFDYMDKDNTCVLQCPLTQGMHCVDECTGKRVPFNGMCLKECDDPGPLGRNPNGLCATTITVNPNIVRQGLQGSDFAIIAVLAVIALAMGVILLVLKKKAKTYRIKSVGDDFYANETDKFWDFALKTRMNKGENAEQQDAKKDDEFDDEHQPVPLRIKM